MFGIPQITPEEAHRLHREGNLVILDVRDPHEIQAAKIEGSLFIHLSQIPLRLNELPRDKDIAVLCRSGNRSSRVTLYLIQNGFKNVKNIMGGIKNWARTVDPTLRPV